MQQPSSNEQRMEEGDKIYLSSGPFSVTYNEVHALLLGAVGIFSGLAYSAGLVNDSLTVTAILFLTSLGLRATPGEIRGKKIPIAVKTTRHEPWWFISSYSVTFIVGAVISGII